MSGSEAPFQKRCTPLAFGGGAIIGMLGGPIGLGGAEFRLPLLIASFRFAALQSVILNKAMSLVVVASALPFRASANRLGRDVLTTEPFDDIPIGYVRTFENILLELVLSTRGGHYLDRDEDLWAGYFVRDVRARHYFNDLARKRTMFSSISREPSPPSMFSSR